MKRDIKVKFKDLKHRGHGGKGKHGADSDDDSSVGYDGARLFDSTSNDSDEKAKNNFPSLGRRLSWSSASTANICEPLYHIAKEDKLTAEKFRILLRPPEFDRDDLLCSVRNFVGGLADYVPSIRHDQTFTVFKSIRSFLSSNESTRLFGLLIHFTYWNVIHPTARSTMRALRELEDLMLFATLDLQSSEIDKRMQLPPALVEIAINQHKLSTPKTYKQIDQLFQEHCELDSNENAKFDPVAEISPYKNLDAMSLGQMSLGSLDSETSLSAMEKEQLFIQLESCILAMFKRMGRGKFALVTGRQALVSCCHFVVDELLSMVYPWLAALHEENPHQDKESKQYKPMSKQKKLNLNITDINLKLRRLIHQSISDLIDPSRVYTSTMLLNALLGFDSSTSIKNVSRKARAITANEGKGKYYRTSSAILALLGDSTSYRARKFLQNSSSLYTSLPGVVKPYTVRTDEHQKALDAKALVKKILDSVEPEEPSAKVQTNVPNQRLLDFSKLSVDQPEADYYPNGRKHLITPKTPLSQRIPTGIRLDYTLALEQGTAIKRRGLSPLRITLPAEKPTKMTFGTDIDMESLGSDMRSVAVNPNAEVPISLKAKTVLMDLMVGKATKLYAAAIQTDKTALKISILKGTENIKKNY